ncbi:uncharacterized protein LOC125178683 [Hyalella azteca]|uniref:Uncharacterized protein LOC125178683 n=1 Tax=Hyalella azteca TaxID=294128 RepID=A0A979FPH6_HYAAZ|nr:uncharacterized protein LOC125178683 [Hyalella azteca]
MAGTGTIAGPAPVAPAITMDDRCIRIYCNIVGNLDLSPRVMRSMLDKECDDKRSNETYRQLMERRLGRAYGNGEWKKLASFSANVLETSTDSTKLDVTPLFLLFTKLFGLGKGGAFKDPTALLAKLGAVKKLRNDVMHDLDNAVDAQKFTELTAALEELVREAGRFYALPQADVDAEVQNLNNDIDKVRRMDSQIIYYWCARLASSGKRAIRLLWKAKFEHEKLSLNHETVQRQEVFHALDMNVRETDGGKTVSYTEIFEAREKVMVVTGVAGAGKTTLVKNIVLQFFNPQQTAPGYLRPFNQLIFFECRDRTTPTLSDVIQQHYEELCIELLKENVLMALLRLDVLFIIDGFDEVNENSRKVVLEIIMKTWRSNCRVLITTRPHAVKELAPLLRLNDVSSTQYEILPLTKLADQLAFLRRYEAALGGDTLTGEVSKSFESLSEDVRSLFTEPINLVHFCEMHKHFPKEISSWKMPGDVAPVKLRLYKELIQTKLAGSINEDSDILIKDMFNAVGAAALELLNDDVLILMEADHLVIKEKIQKTPKSNDEVDPAAVLSVMLKEHKPLCSNRSSSYEFKHKSEQEMFAGNYIVQRIIGGYADSLYSILGVPKEGMSRLREVLLYVVAALSRDSPRHLTRRWPQLKEALCYAGVTRNAVMACVASCPNAGMLGDLVGDGSSLHVREDRHVDAAVAMLSLSKPDAVEVYMEAAALRGAPWGALVAAAGGAGVWLTLSSPDAYEPHDDLLLPLHDSG